MKKEERTDKREEKNKRKNEMNKLNRVQNILHTKAFSLARKNNACAYECACATVAVR